ncbi:molybdopterin-dependent oxidoreductase [Thalassobaculum litoreum]|uniref:CO or xanthine dehydrogenase, Mo-binding subunit n=1 Tax=Thalassobaculum litoreum DSM 18839 TaxID=1123362 RepID=A0A8G2BKZ2_9PROT|nr:molybdopterin cofactor-binding domain-containing protein [Thalassobaculum litoreum]SDG31519.1 CO or xanthine dehydrogenase, Mo-binding subunit [Thalassobaculum litoreum DSM 18839]
MTATLTFTVNGSECRVDVAPQRRLSRVLREDLGLTGTKVGCDAGDCGACTVLLDGAQVCACLVPAGQAEGGEVVTVEGLADRDGTHSALQRAFARHGAAQCGICTPGMLMAAHDLLRRNPQPGRAAVEDALGGVLCRCTGYLKIVEAVLDVASNAPDTEAPAPGTAVGARVARLDGVGKLDGRDLYGDDTTPADALWLRVLRSPHALADFAFGDVDAWAAAVPGVVAVLTARDVPGHNSFGIYPTLKDQPVFAEGFVRYRGEAVAAVIVETRAAFEALDLSGFPVDWSPREAVVGVEAALKEGALRLHEASPGNVLIRGRVASGDVDAAMAGADAVVEAAMQTGFVEHSYIEPEAGWARRAGDRVELRVTTQTPYMDRDEVAHVLGIAQEAVRVTPSVVGGGFGGKLDQSIQLPLAVATWKLGRPVATLYHRPESFAATTKRHPARMTASLGVTRDGAITGFRFHGDFDTGAYASWGPTVAGRVPVHAPGPYRVGAVLASSAAVYTDGPPAGAFRGFGVPQAAIIGERLMDEAAGRIGMDPLEFRLLNALRAGDPTATGQVIEASVGLAACIEALKPAWARYGEQVAAHNAKAGRTRLGAGIGCMWYGCGNTSMSNPSIMRLALKPDGRLTLFNGAVDIGQGSYTIMAQIAADALGAPLSLVDQVWGDTDLTPDAGKTSASRQTFVSGRASELAGRDLRARILRLANAGEDAELTFDGGRIVVRDAAGLRDLDLSVLPVDGDGHLLVGEGTFDPPTAPLDADGQGTPYATYAFAAQIALVEVDPELGTTKVLHMTAAHDVGWAVNPTLVEGQIHGGIAQGLGLALMEEYVPGRTENLHDYLIPTVGDMPQIDCILIEDPEPLGPFGAKGIGEPALVPTAPAILAGIRQAVGVCPDKVPVLPHRLRAAIRAAQTREAAE